MAKDATRQHLNSIHLSIQAGGTPGPFIRFLCGSLCCSHDRFVNRWKSKLLICASANEISHVQILLIKWPRAICSGQYPGQADPFLKGTGRVAGYGMIKNGGDRRQLNNCEGVSIPTCLSFYTRHS